MTTAYNPTTSFREAASYLSNASSLHSVSDAVKLELYAIFKYLTVSPSPNTPRPSLFDFTGKAKWDAWKSAGEQYKDPAEAEQRYLEIARSLGWSEGSSAQQKSEAAGEDGEEDIWDKDEDTAKRKGGGMGPVLSTLTMDDEENSNTLSNLAIAGDVQMLEVYLQTHPEVDLDAPDENGYTPLHLAADRGHLDFVKALLRRGAKKDIKDEDEFTARELAEIAGHDEIANLLSDTQNAPS